MHPRARGIIKTKLSLENSKQKGNRSKSNGRRKSKRARLSGDALVVLLLLPRPDKKGTKEQKPK